MKVICPNCQIQYELIPPEKTTRTNLQNRYYWGCVVEIPAREISYSPEEMHEAYKLMFLKKSESDHKHPATVRSTTSLTTVEFSEYVEKCRRWCAEQGYVIPDPEEVSGEI